MKTQNNHPIISVVMCTYNTEKFIAEAVESVLNQTFRDFEFIIWDDGSTDGTKEIVESFNDDRIRYFYHDNTGLGMALRLACSEAHGKYIARMDSDDICLPNRLEKEVKYLESHGDYVLVSSAVCEIDENGDYLRRTFPCNDDKVLKGVLSYPSNMIVHPMVMMRRDAYQRAGGYLPIRKSQDVLFWSRLAKQGRFYNLSKPLGKYRILSSSLDHSKNPYKPLLVELLKKMIKDEVVLESDIELYNQLFLYSKPFIVKEKAVPNKRRKITVEETTFNILRCLLGEKAALRIIIGIKNIYYRKKLRAI